MKKYILGAVLSLGILMTPAATMAAGLTNTQIQSILSLLSAFGADAGTIANVTTALNGGTPSTRGSAFCHTWNTDLTVGSQGDDVSALNQALTASGIDTTGNTSVFSENNAGDVVSFQSHYGIRQTGYVGPMTRAKLNALYGCSSVQTLAPTPASTTAPSSSSNTTPVITSVSTKGSGDFEMNAGGTASIWGAYLAGEAMTPKVYIGGVQAPVVQVLGTANTSIYINVPSSLTPGSYPLYVVSSYGTSNTVTVKILGSSASTSTITLFSNKDPNPSTGAVDIIWNTSSPASVALDMNCTGTLSFTTSKGNSPSCQKGGVWVWQGVSSGDIMLTSQNAKSVTVRFTLTVLDANGNYTSQKQTISVTFP